MLGKCLQMKLGQSMREPSQLWWKTTCWCILLMQILKRYFCMHTVFIWWQNEDYVISMIKWSQVSIFFNYQSFTILYRNIWCTACLAFTCKWVWHSSELYNIYRVEWSMKKSMVYTRNCWLLKTSIQLW